MDEPKTIYVVVDGEYSDYSIQAIFSTKEQAGRYISVDGGRIEEWIMDDPECVDAIKSTQYMVILRHNGDVYNQMEFAGITHSKNSRGFGMVREILQETMFEGLSYESIDHAMKLAVEARQKWLRENAWPSE